MNINFSNIFRMITCQEKALDEMRRGLFDVLPSGSLDALTAEDFRLLLNGVSEMDIKDLENPISSYWLYTGHSISLTIQ